MGVGEGKEKGEQGRTGSTSSSKNGIGGHWGRTERDGGCSSKVRQ